MVTPRTMKLDGAEVARHNSRAKGAWLAVHDEVWDVTGMMRILSSTDKSRRF